MSLPGTLLYDLRRALDAHERSGIHRGPLGLSEFLLAYVEQAMSIREEHKRADAAAANGASDRFATLDREYADASPRTMDHEARDFTAYAEGLRNGKADRLLGQRSRYAEAPEHGPYANGYRRGVLGLDEPAGSRS